MLDKYLTTEQVANILQVHPFTILKYIKSGKIKSVKIGRLYRINETDIKDFLEKMTVNGNRKQKIIEAKPEPEKKIIKEKHEEKHEENIKEIEIVEEFIQESKDSYEIKASNLESEDISEEISEIYKI